MLVLNISVLIKEWMGGGRKEKENFPFSRIRVTDRVSEKEWRWSV